MQYEWKQSPCSVGIDFGGGASQTAITVVTHYQNKIILLYQFAQANFDENLLMDKFWQDSIPNLCERYNVQHIITDDCPQSTRTNAQLINEGYPVKKFNFLADAFLGERNRGYYMVRSALKQYKIQFPDVKEFISELKALEETKIESGKFMRIKAPKNHYCDRADSWMEACYPFLSEEGSFSSELVDYDSIKEEIMAETSNPRYDKQWEELKNRNDPFGFLLKKEIK